MMKIETAIAFLAFCSVATAFVLPTASMAQSLKLRSGGLSPSARCGAMAHRRTGRAQISMMATQDENEARFRAAEDAEIARRRAEEKDLEKRYRQENSGLGFRKNQQDGLIFAMGKCLDDSWNRLFRSDCHILSHLLRSVRLFSGGLIIVLPLVFVGIAIATGYVPLDYLR
jgi:hypothetical protein